MGSCVQPVVRREGPKRPCGLEGAEAVEHLTVLARVLGCAAYLEELPQEEKTRVLITQGESFVSELRGQDPAQLADALTLRLETRGRTPSNLVPFLQELRNACADWTGYIDNGCLVLLVDW